MSSLPVWQVRLAIMAACTVPGVLVRLSGAPIPPPLGMFVFGGAVMAAAFMLASAAEAAEIDAPPGIAVAGVALVAVLPEYVIEVYFAFSGHVEFVTASLTGSTRLLLSVAVGMPAIASVVLGQRGRPPSTRRSSFCAAIWPGPTPWSCSVSMPSTCAASPRARPSPRTSWAWPRSSAS
jgi:hypothetical protein